MILKCENLSIAFGPKRVLNGVSFGIERGETVALMGPNGAGKTTILRCALGLLQYEGRIEVDGFDVRRQGVAARSRMGYVPQVPAFYDMTAREMVRFLAKLRRVPVESADAALKRVGLDGDADRAVRAFSGGMQQRLSLAAVLLGDPPLILLDEPTANLDPAARADLLDLLNDFRKAGKTLVLSSHRPREVRGLVDRVIVLRDGAIAAQGRPDEVLPPDRMSLCVEAHEAAEKSRLARLLGVDPLPSSNGSFCATIDAAEIVAALERLREGEVARGRITVRPIEDGGLS
ncbi:MAG: ABC transporter ATP-binding protein [Planctomycetes bacterium]|nr:ABC transporter ATP-binding protein [Planctomycetota bacterium]